MTSSHKKYFFFKLFSLGSTIIRCDCENACVSKEFDIQLDVKHDDKLYNCETQKEPLLYKNDATAIEKWSQQVTNHLNHTNTKSVTFSDNPIATPTSPHKPRQSQPSHYYDIENQQPLNSNLNKTTNGLEMLIEAANYIESIKPIDQSIGAENESSGMETLTMPQEEVVTEYDSSLVYCETGFENLLMLAEEAVKRIHIERPRKF